MARTQVAQRTLGRQEQQLKTARSVFESLSVLQSSAWFVALSNVFSKLNEFFMRYSRYFFSVTVLFSVIDWGLMLAKYLASPNKNLKNTSKLSYKTFNLLAYAAIIAAFFIGGMALSGTFYYVFCLIDPVVNLFKAGAYAYLMYNAKNHQERELFYGKCIKSVKNAVIVGVILLAMLTLFVIPGLPLAVTIAVGAIGAVVTAGYGLFSLGSLIKNAFSQKDSQSLVDQLNEPLLSTAKLDVTNKVIRRLGDTSKYHAKFYRHSSLDNLTLSALDEKVSEKMGKFKKKATLSSDGFFSDKSKYEDKNQAMAFLHELLQKLKGHEVRESGELQIDKVKIGYTSRSELCDKIDQHIIETYPKAYQHFSRYYSRVQVCFQDAYDLIKAADTLHEQDTDTSLGLRQ